MSFATSKSFVQVLMSLTMEQLRALPAPPAEDLSPEQIHRDKNFLDILVLDTIQGFLKEWGAKIPRLQTEAKASNSRTKSFYTPEIGVEIHQLLVLLLDEFTRLLPVVEDIVQAKVLIPAAKKFDLLIGAVHKLWVTASLLWHLIYSSALAIHIVRIVSYLVAESEKQDMPAASFDDQDGGGNEDGDDDGDNSDDDLDGIDEVIPIVSEETKKVPSSKKMFDTLPTDLQRDIAASYLRWFRRQVIQVEAVHIICGLASRVAARSQAPRLSIKLISVHHPGNDMLKWRDVVRELVQNMNSPGITPELAIQEVIKAKKMFESQVLPFRGNLHCEACLASLARNDLQSISKEFEVMLPPTYASIDLTVGKACQ
jgi:hypothetical protein